MRECDVVVVGGAAAGLVAAMYTARRALKTIVVTTDIGGQASLTSGIENYPGRERVAGFQLMTDFKEQAEKFGVEIVIDEALELKVISKTSFIVKAYNAEYHAKSVVLAFGLTPKELGVPGEEKFKGRGVSTCVTCDGPLYKNKKVVVTGVGDSALDAVQFLCNVNADVTYICPRPSLVGSKQMVSAVEAMRHVTIHLNTRITGVLGDDKLTGVTIKTEDKEEQEIYCDGVFAEMGYVTKADWVEGVVELDAQKHIIIDQNMATSTPGIFAAGDITTTSYKQVVVSAGEGAKAGLSLHKYLQQHGVINTSSPVDWGILKS